MYNIPITNITTDWLWQWLCDYCTGLWANDFCIIIPSHVFSEKRFVPILIGFIKKIIFGYLPTFQDKFCAKKFSRLFSLLLSISATVVKDSRPLSHSDFSMTWRARRKKLSRLNLRENYKKPSLLWLLEFCHQLNLVLRWIKLWKNLSLWKFDFHISVA